MKVVLPLLALCLLTVASQHGHNKGNSVAGCHTIQDCKSGQGGRQTQLDIECSPGLSWEFYKLERCSSDTTISPGCIPYRGTDPWTYDLALDLLVSVRGQRPSRRGNTTLLGFKFPGGNGDMFGTGDAHVEYSVITNHGYFHPNVTGSYTFVFPHVDETVYLWLGDKAGSYTKANADARAVEAGVSHSVNRYFTFAVEAGYYYPFKLFFANAQSWATMRVQFMDPFGRPIAFYNEDDNRRVPITNQFCQDSSTFFTAQSPYYMDTYLKQSGEKARQDGHSSGDMEL